MAQPIQQVALRAPGFQGINTELSPINGDPEFALVADNVVVDQIGRLTSRKAFSNYLYVDDYLPVDRTYPITTVTGVYVGIYPLEDHYKYKPPNIFSTSNMPHAWYAQQSIDIYLRQLDTWDHGDTTAATYTLEFTANILESISEVIPNDAPLDESLFSSEIVELSCSEYNPSGPPNPRSEDVIEGNWVRLDGYTTSDGKPGHCYRLTGKAATKLTYEIHDTYDGKIDFAWWRYRGTSGPWPTIEIYVDVSIDSLSVKGMAPGDRGRNEIIKLGKDIIGSTDVHDQNNFRPVMIYRYSDKFVYPDDTRAIPVGMGRKRAIQKQLPELDSDTTNYDVGTINPSTLKFEHLNIPEAYKNEVLLTSQFINFGAEDLTAGNDRLLLFVKGKQFLRLDNDATFNEVDANWTDGTGNKYPIDGDIAVSAYGRVWVTGVGGDYHQIHYSALLDETEWYQEGVDPKDPDKPFNDAGIIDVREYWPVDGDTIVNIHAHNGFLIVFGRNSILVYANADSGTPAGILGQASSGIFLEDTISNVGLVRRDAICNIGTDVLFVDDSGVRSLGRVIQEKSTPIQEPSLNIRRELQGVIQQELAGSVSLSAIKLQYLPSESLAVLLFSSLKIAYAFHLATPSKTGGMKVTRWTDCFWNDAIELKQAQEDVVLLAGKPTKGLLKYKDYLKGTDEGTITPYIMRYESMALAIGSSPMQTIIPKSINFVCMGEYVPGQANALWGFSDKFIGNQEFLIKVDGGSAYNVNYFDDEGDVDLAGRYRDGDIRYDGYKINTTGSGELFRVGFQVKVQGGRYALQEINVNTAVGRLRA